MAEESERAKKSSDKNSQEGRKKVSDENKSLFRERGDAEGGAAENEINRYKTKHSQNAMNNLLIARLEFYGVRGPKLVAPIHIIFSLKTAQI